MVEGANSYLRKSLEYTRGVLHRLRPWCSDVAKYLPQMTPSKSRSLCAEEMRSTITLRCAYEHHISGDSLRTCLRYQESWEDAKKRNVDAYFVNNTCAMKIFTISPWYCIMFNPLTPKSDQFPISPAASPVILHIILHHTVWRTWLFMAYSDERWLYYQFALPHLHISY